MDVTVRLFASLRERAGADALTLEGLPDELSVGELKAELARRHPELGDLGHVRGVLGTRYAPDDAPVRATDEVSLLPPVSGGSGEAEPDYEAGVFELLGTPLDPGAAQARVADPRCGAIVLFTGTTRDRNRGQDVSLLDYEAFEAMTGPEMGRIFEDGRAAALAEARRDDPAASAPLLRMLCQHRTGRVGVGEPSVVIAVASPHRAPAFHAARYLIDTLKERVPIWKKERYADGEEWIAEHP